VDGSSERTSPTLLGRLRTSPADQEAWRAFVERYGPRIYAWCRRWNLPEQDAQDVTQNVLARLVEALRRFQYDSSRSFRGWLQTLTHHAWYDFVTARGRGGATGDTETLRYLETVEAREDLAAKLAEEFDQEVLEQAMKRVQAIVLPTHWDAFRLTALEGLSGAEAAERTGMQVATVYVIRGKVQKQIQEEVQALESADVPGG
jgi:RNA polymerase sigma-70 factor (ECF subfamily)